MLRHAAWLLLVALLSPPAAAQTPVDPVIELRVVAPFEGRLAPEVGQVRVPIMATVNCSPEDFVPPQQNATFKVVSTAPYARAIMDPEVRIFEALPQQCSDPNWRAELTTELVVTTDRTAPAYQPFTTTVSVSVQGVQGSYGPVEVSTDIENDYFPLGVVNPAELFIQVDPGRHFEFPMEVTNLANGESKFTFEATGDPPSIEPPPTVTLESTAVKGPGAKNKQAVVLGGRAPNQFGYENRIRSIQMTVTTTSSQQPDALEDQQTLFFTIQVKGVTKAPGAGLGLGTLALMAAVSLSRNRRP